MKTLLAAIAGLAAVAALFAPTSAEVEPRLTFTPGSYCTSFSGQLPPEKTFKIDLQKGQYIVFPVDSPETFNVGTNITDTRGRDLDVDWTDGAILVTNSSGDHLIKVSSLTGEKYPTTARFKVCAYPSLEAVKLHPPH